jgi:hypothetical protein
VTFTAVRYEGLNAVRGAIHMATHRAPLAREPGLRFWKLLGFGSGIGFSMRPDLSLWGLLAVWTSATDWSRFACESRPMRHYREQGAEIYTLFLEPIRSRGLWSGTEPFLPTARSPTTKARSASQVSTLSGGREGGDPATPSDSGVVVLTRARIRLSRLARFWRAVPPVDAILRDHPALVLSFGVGEVPFVFQGTLSVWRSQDELAKWAYRDPAHADVMDRTRVERWYAEELFARFRLVGSEGTFKGVDPLAGLVPQVD